MAGFDVAVHDAAGVYGREARGEVAGDAYRALGCEGAVTGEVCGEGVALDEVHDDVGHAVVDARVEEGHDVGVSHLPRGVGLAQKTLARDGVERALGVEHLHRGAARNVDVAGGKHPRGRALAEQTLQAPVPQAAGQLQDAQRRPWPYFHFAGSGSVNAV